jgi:signal peptidase I
MGWFLLFVVREGFVDINQVLKRTSIRAKIRALIYDWLNVFLCSVMVVFLLFTFFFRVAGVVGGSMNPTLSDEDILLVSRLRSLPNYGDIVVISENNALGENLIKRVIGLPGDEIYINFQEGEVFRNGELLNENALYALAAPTMRSFDVVFPVTVPENCVFVMGDNRNNSVDSRDSRVGMVDIRHILGTATYKMFPFEKLK